MHTKENLDALQRKGLVTEIAEGLGLDVSGTRNEITDLILEHQKAAEAAAAAEAAYKAAAAAAYKAERARDEEGKFEGDVAGTQPSEAYEPPAPQAISAKAQTGADQLLDSYFGKKGVSKETRTATTRALELGFQPCIVEGEGNAKFDFAVFDRPFDRQDVSKDASRSKDRVVLNIARRLANSHLYPSA